MRTYTNQLQSSLVDHLGKDSRASHLQKMELSYLCIEYDIICINVNLY